jgi:hypothetical protein
MNDYELRKVDCATRSEILFKCKNIRWKIKLRLLCNMFRQEYSTIFVRVSEIREHESWSLPFLAFSYSTYIFNFTTKCTYSYTTEYLCCLRTLQTCFGAECAILRENSYHFSKPCAIVRLSQWLINFMLCTSHVQTYLTIWLRDASTSLKFSSCTFCPHCIYVLCKQRLVPLTA